MVAAAPPAVKQHPYGHDREYLVRRSAFVTNALSSNIPATVRCCHDEVQIRLHRRNRWPMSRINPSDPIFARETPSGRLAMRTTIHISLLAQAALPHSRNFAALDGIGLAEEIEAMAFLRDERRMWLELFNADGRWTLDQLSDDDFATLINPPQRRFCQDGAGLSGRRQRPMRKPGASLAPDFSDHAIAPRE